jgi:hypothetical protein
MRESQRSIVATKPEERATLLDSQRQGKKKTETHKKSVKISRAYPRRDYRKSRPRFPRNTIFQHVSGDSTISMIQKIKQKRKKKERFSSLKEAMNVDC